MESTVKIALYEEKYKEEIISLILNIQQNEFSISITIDDQPDLNDISGYYLSGGGYFLVALYNNSVIGTVSLLNIGSGRGALRKMFVSSEYRGERFKTAHALLNTLLEKTRDDGYREIYLGTTTRYLAAHRFYEKKGFIRIDKSDLPENFPVMRVDTVFYKYLL